MKNINTESVINALSNTTRMRSVLLLLEQEELCVCELNDLIGGAQPNISRNLGQLRDIGLVIDRREGQWIYYRLNPDLPEWVSGILQASKTGAVGHEPYKTDLIKLKKITRSTESRCRN
ncbi:MAG: metalloregulator ArsR/SmtB family transcription factor [Shewanella sp.]|nr:metalloregulator ArsR/SmtB family transcription factor [Shewanella sp.]MCG7905168.1 metalloregulator ArsR/SmtB family transcription factor [Candidatus Thiodiazotropha taylori]MCG7937132.1 metalloregulator ArsR/SmtB family transcription factor [Candidatus Thiodiazotropha taylori]